MKENIERFTLQLDEALHIAEASQITHPEHPIHNIVISGMGGSGISADIIQSLAMHTGTLPITVVKGYTIPAFVNHHTLFIASSYSGNTEETLSCLEEAISGHAKTVCVTSNGAMLSRAEEANLATIPLPAGSDSPRAMLGYSITALLYALHRCDLMDHSFIDETRRAIDILNKQENAIQQQARQISVQMQDKIPVIYGEVSTRAIAVRFQNQLNENAKYFAHVNLFPEMNHNEIEGWLYPERLLPHLQPIYLTTNHIHKRIKRRMQICQKLFERKSNPIITLLPEGQSLLEQYYFLIHLTDWISFFLAEAHQINPNRIDAIKYLKEQLNKEQ